MGQILTIGRLIGPYGSENEEVELISSRLVKLPVGFEEAVSPVFAA